MSEIVMIGENMCKKITDSYVYPGIEENDEEDELVQSLDNYSDLEFGLRRQRSNTAARLEKMEKERKESANITRVKWHTGRPFSTLTEEEKDEMFGPKDMTKICTNRDRKTSLLTLQLQKCSYLPQNVFQEFSKFDGSVQVGVPTRRYGIFLTMVKPEYRGYPLLVNVITTAKVYDLTGLILWKCSLEHPDCLLKENVSDYGLNIVDDDGEVDWLFPSLDPNETIAKFLYRMLALVEHNENEGSNSSNRNDFNAFKEISFSGSQDKDEVDHLDEDVKNLQDQVTAIEASLYMSYKVLMLNKVRGKMEVYLGVSGEKVDLDPILKQSSKFISKRKPKSYNADYIVACELIESKSNRAVFRLVYDRHDTNPSETVYSSQLDPHLWNNFKHHDFECDQHTAEQIVQKLNYILQLRCSARRKDYLAMRERKSVRKKSSHFGPR